MAPAIEPAEPAPPGQAAAAVMLNSYQQQSHNQHLLSDSHYCYTLVISTCMAM